MGSVTHWMKRTKTNLGGNFLLRLMLIYLAVVLALVTTFWIFVRSYLLRGLELELEQLERNKLTTTQTTLTLLLGEMDKGAVNLAINSRLQQYALLPREEIPKHHLDIRNVQELLSNTINSSSYIRNIIVYYETSQTVLDYSGLLNVDQFYDQGWIAAYQSMSASSLYLNIRTVRDRSVTESRSGTEMITLITAFPYGYLERHGAIIFLIDERLIREQLQTLAPPDSDALAILINGEGQIMSTSQESYRGQSMNTLLQLPASAATAQPVPQQILFHNRQAAVYESPAGIRDWRLLYILPLNQLYEKSASLQLILLIVLAALLILLSLGFSFLAARLCAPIRRSMQIVRRLPLPQSEAMDDVQAINSSIRLLYANNQLLEQQLEASRLTLREHFLNQLISGRIFSRDEVLRRADYLAVDLDATAFKAAIVHLNPGGAAEPDFERIEQEMNRFGGAAKSMFSELGIANEFFRNIEGDPVLLWKFAPGSDLQALDVLTEQTLEELHNQLRQFSSLNFNIGVGRIHQDLTGIQISVQEALQALRFKYLEEEPGIILYEQIVGSHDDSPEPCFPTELESQLADRIDLGDCAGAIALFNKLVQTILNNGHSFQRIEQDLDRLAGIVPRCADAVQIPLDQLAGADFTLLPVSHFRSVTQFSDWMINQIRLLCEARLNQLRDSTPDFRTEVTRYLAEVFRQEISLVSVADHFQLSAAYFSKLFRDQMGVSFWDYVTRLRIDQARQLLRDGADSIEQVALEVGYNNRYSFIRSFKKITALTPSEYREHFLRVRSSRKGDEHVL